jgi:hypothetical protein
MIITVYKKSNGEILKTCNCTESDIPMQYDGSTESFIYGTYSGSDYYIENSNLVAIPESPNQFYTFDIDKKQWIDKRTLISNESRWDLIKAQRNQLLLTSDWTDTLSAKVRLGDTTYTAWQEYRQALRDITTQTDPFNITWPVSPT